MNEFILTKKVFKKDDQEFVYFELSIDLGYRKCVVTKDKQVICAVCDMTERQLYDLVTDKPMSFGKLTKKGDK